MVEEESVKEVDRPKSSGRTRLAQLAQAKDPAIQQQMRQYRSQQPKGQLDVEPQPGILKAGIAQLCIHLPRD